MDYFFGAMSWPAIINGNKSGDLSPETEFLLDCRREGLLCDATVKNGKVLYSVHKVIVAAASPYWESEFEGNSSLPPFATLDVSSENLGDESVSAVLEWIYTGRISAPDWKSLLKIMAAASALKIDCLFSQCQEALVQRLEASNVFSLWFQAERIRHEELGSVCCKYAAIHFPELLRRDRTSVMDLPAEYLKRMLNHDHLSLASEEDVWGIMLEWVLHGEGVAAEDRTQHLPELLSTLRLGLLSERFFREKIVQCDLLSNNLWMKVLLEGKLFYKNAALYKLLRHFSDRSIDKWRQRVPANVALIVESSNNVVGNSSIIVRWFDSRQDKWHVTKPIKEPVLGGSIIYPVMCSSAKTKVIFVLQDMSTLATATKVISVDLLTLAFKELSTLHDFSGTQKLVCVNNDIIVLKYFPNKSFQLYDKSRNQWTGHELEDDDLPIAIGCSVCAVGGKIYLVGGKLLDAQGSYSTIISVYNPDLNKFVRKFWTTRQAV